MGRRLNSRQYGKRQALAKAREDYQDTVRPPRAYQQSGLISEYTYRSLQQPGILWKIRVRNASANALVSGTYGEDKLDDAELETLGLLPSEATGNPTFRIRGTGQRPTQVAWYHAGNTPVSKLTPWGTTSVTFASKTGTGRDAQSHRTCAVGDPTATPTIIGMMGKVTALLTRAKKTALTGGPRGGIYLLPEISEISLE